MKLRNLELKDAPLMIEWMHDKTVVEKLRGDFVEKKIDDCMKFIRDSQNMNDDIHLAIVSDEDEYMGTVSLKNINIKSKSAEFAIVVRKSAMGRGYAWFGMSAILKKAFKEYGLEKVYWCVSKENDRAIRFYDKHSFQKIEKVPRDIIIRYQDMDDLKWYASFK